MPFCIIPPPLFINLLPPSLNISIPTFQGFKLKKQPWEEMTSIPLILHYPPTLNPPTNPFTFVLSLGMLIFLTQNLNPRNGYIQRRRVYNLGALLLTSSLLLLNADKRKGSISLRSWLSLNMSCLACCGGEDTQRAPDSGGPYPGGYPASNIPQSYLLCSALIHRHIFSLICHTSNYCL
jgi:hypothetical protein